MKCPNGCRGNLVLVDVGDWDEHYHCEDCGANWWDEELEEYEQELERENLTAAKQAAMPSGSQDFHPSSEPSKCGVDYKHIFQQKVTA